MIKKKKVCVSCKNESYIWSKKRCKTCFNKEFPLKNIKKYSEKGLIKKELKKEYTKKQFELFQEIYKEHPTKRCYECGKWVNGESSAQFHHLIFKSIAPELALVKENIVLICENCHTQVHQDSSKTPKLADLTQKIKEIYE